MFILGGIFSRSDLVFPLWGISIYLSRVRLESERNQRLPCSLVLISYLFMWRWGRSRGEAMAHSTNRRRFSCQFLRMWPGRVRLGIWRLVSDSEYPHKSGPRTFLFVEPTRFSRDVVRMRIWRLPVYLAGAICHFCILSTIK